MTALFKKSRAAKQTEQLKSDKNNSQSADNERFNNSLKQKIEDIIDEDLGNYGNKFLSLIAKEKEILQAVIFISEYQEDETTLRFLCGYACSDSVKSYTFKPGEGLAGQAFKDEKLVNLKEFPAGYITVKTGLGEASPKSLLLIPILDSGNALGIIELSSFHDFSKDDEIFFTEVSSLLAKRIINKG